MGKNFQFYDGEIVPENADSYFEWLTDVFTEDLGQEEYKCTDNGSLMKLSPQLIHTTNLSYIQREVGARQGPFCWPEGAVLGRISALNIMELFELEKNLKIINMCIFVLN